MKRRAEKLLADKELQEQFGNAVKLFSQFVADTTRNISARRISFNLKKQQIEKEMTNGGQKSSGIII